MDIWTIVFFINWVLISLTVIIDGVFLNDRLGYISWLYPLLGLWSIASLLSLPGIIVYWLAKI